MVPPLCGQRELSDIAVDREVFRVDLVPPLCGQRELSDIAVDREVFRVDLGLLPPRPPSKEKRARK